MATRDSVAVEPWVRRRLPPEILKAKLQAEVGPVEHHPNRGLEDR